jgi:hypothetical protein
MLTPLLEDRHVVREELVVGETGVQKEEAHADARLITDKEEPAWLQQISSLLGRAICPLIALGLRDLQEEMSARVPLDEAYDMLTSLP